MAEAGVLTKIAPESLEADLQTEEGRRLRERDIARLFRLLCQTGIDADYLAPALKTLIAKTQVAGSVKPRPYVLDTGIRPDAYTLSARVMPSAYTVAGRVTPDAYVISCCINTGGVQKMAIREESTTYSIALTDHTVLLDASGGAFTATLPTAASAHDGLVGCVFNVKRINSGGNRPILSGNGAELIDGSNTFTFNAQYTSLTVQSDGTQWWIL